MNIFDLDVYKQSMEIGEKVWSIVNKWNYFEKDSIGNQLVKAVDSVAANLSEGYGRYHFKDKKNFGYYSRGSLYETRTWLEKAQNRNLITENDFKYFRENINIIGRLLNGYIKSIGNIQTTDGNIANEPEADYYSSDEDIFPLE
jgi:four helix bundle protein